MVACLGVSEVGAGSDVASECTSCVKKTHLNRPSQLVKPAYEAQQKLSKWYDLQVNRAFRKLSPWPCHPLLQAYERWRSSAETTLSSTGAKCGRRTRFRRTGCVAWPTRAATGPRTKISPSSASPWTPRVSEIFDFLGGYPDLLDVLGNA